MSALRHRGLRLDAPLSPGRSSQARESAPFPHAIVRSRATDNGRVGSQHESAAPAPVGEPGRRKKRNGRTAVEREESAAREHAGLSSGDVWRAWSGITGVGSFRLPHELVVELADTAGERAEGGIRITVPLTQDDLAQWVAGSRESVARALASLRKRGLISTARREIVVLDLDGLRAAAR